jgi:hypothetical protein
LSSNIPGPIKVSLAFLAIVLLLSSFAYGVALQRYKLPPHALIEDTIVAIKWLVDRSPASLQWYYNKNTRQTPHPLSDSHPERDALNLVSSMAANDTLALQIIDMQGEIKHSWDVDIFNIWPQPAHLQPSVWPKTRPGTEVHGTKLMPNGDVVFNYENIGTVRMDWCGNVVWRLPYETHHSVFVAEDGNLWISGRRVLQKKLPNYPLHQTPVWDPTVLEVSPEGEILREISVMDLFRDNNLLALLMMRNSSIYNYISGDNLHMNDVEVFPSSVAEGVFKHGDVVISLRNIHTILVFNPDTLKVRYVKTGGFIRQHDPDFIDGNTLTLFDNNYVTNSPIRSSRIISLDARSNEIETVYSGSETAEFSSKIMGKHQWLENGRLLITESRSGRAFELDQNGQIIWEYLNKVDADTLGIITEAHRLDASARSLLERTSCDSIESS